MSLLYLQGRALYYESLQVGRRDRPIATLSWNTDAVPGTTITRKTLVAIIEEALRSFHQHDEDTHG